MKRIFACVLGLLMTNTVFAADNIDYNSPLGQWETIDDKTGKPHGVVTISQAANGTLEAVIEKSIKVDDQEPRQICDLCTGELKNHPIIGLKFMWDMKPKGSHYWEDGKILDPDSGKVYSSHMTLAEDGKKLEVRGYMGVSLLGRSQEWLRVVE